MTVEGFLPVKKGENALIIGEKRLYLYSPTNSKTATEKWKKSFKVSKYDLSCTNTTTGLRVNTSISACFVRSLNVTYDSL